MTDGFHTPQTPEPREPEVPPSGGATWRPLPDAAQADPGGSLGGPAPVGEPAEPTAGAGNPPAAGGEPTPPGGEPRGTGPDPTWPGAGQAATQGSHSGAPGSPGAGWVPPGADPTWPGTGWPSPAGSGEPATGAGWHGGGAAAAGGGAGWQGGGGVAWHQPAGAGWHGGGWASPGSGWGAAAPGWMPPGGWGPPPAPHKPLRRSHLVAIGVAAAVVVLLLGTGLGYLVRSPGTTPSASTAPNGSSGTPFTRFRSGTVTGGTTSGGSSGGGSRSSQASGSPSDVTAIAAKVDPGLVDINTKMKDQNEEAAGTGMVLTASGEVLTNNHVIEEATTISATDIGNGKTYTATVVGYDRSNDVAVLQLKGASGLTTVSIGDSSKASAGEGVVGIGNAGGVGGTPSTAGGSITALDQSITASDSGDGTSEKLNGLIETNCGIEPGDSGGPLVTSAGQVIGMDTAASGSTGNGGEFAYQTTSTTTGGNQGYAIPIDEAVTLAKKFEAGQASSTIHIGETAFLGVEVSSSGTTGTTGSGNPFRTGFGTRFTTPSATTGGSRPSTTSGADIAGVITGTPAATAGLARGDVITTFGGTAITSSTTLTSALVGYHPGDHVKVTWTGSGGQQSATITLANGPAA